MRPTLNAKSRSFGFEGQKLDKLRRVDFALFVSVWWPRASYETCVTIVYLCIWLFVWDDEIDLEENVTGTDFGAAQTFRRQTLEVVEYNLGFGDQAKKEPISPNAIIGGFREVGRRLRSSYNESWYPLVSMSRKSASALTGLQLLIWVMQDKSGDCLMNYHFT